MEDLLLSILEGHLGRFVSGEEIGRQIGISRAAVWKHIRARAIEVSGFKGPGGPATGFSGAPT